MFQFHVKCERKTNLKKFRGSMSLDASWLFHILIKDTFMMLLAQETQ